MRIPRTVSRLAWVMVAERGCQEIMYLQLQVVS